MTYKKPSIQVSGTTLMGIDFSGDANAYEALKAHKTIKTEAENRKLLVPFHAVKSAFYGIFTEDTERTDPYCGGTEPVGEVWYTGTLGECQNGTAIAFLTATDKANPQDLFDNSDDYLVYANGEPMPSVTKGGNGETKAFEMTWTGTGSFQTFESLDTKEWVETYFFIACPTDITTVEITVAKK